MNQYDVAGILKTYAEKSIKCRDKEQLANLIRKLKHEEFKSCEIQKMKVINNEV